MTIKEGILEVLNRPCCKNMKLKCAYFQFEICSDNGFHVEEGKKNLKQNYTEKEYEDWLTSLDFDAELPSDIWSTLWIGDTHWATWSDEKWILNAVPTIDECLIA